MPATTPTDHTLHREWRLPRIESLRTDALVIRETLQHLDDLAALFEYTRQEAQLSDIRSLSGRLKSMASDYETEAESLQAEVAEHEALVQ